ncbi:MAG: hypothetical protein HYY95_14110 [Candidatus Rokubacteria bacterium]|nr:hypothetical protein [Candidatus Rokubacteria bacterium]
MHPRDGRVRRSEDRRRSTGCFRFGEHWDKPAEDLIIEAFTECIQDAGIGRDEIEAFRGRRIVGPGPSSVLGPSSTFSLISRIGLEHKLDEILEEAARVREELGYVNMVTPTSQLVGTQAVINVVQGERYRTVPDEVIRYALGHYGKPLAPLAPDVLDRIHQTPAARLYTSREPEKSVIERVRARFGGPRLPSPDARPRSPRRSSTWSAPWSRSGGSPRCGSTRRRSG